MSGSQWAIRKGAPLLLLLFALPPMLGQMLFPSPFTFMPCPLEEVTSILSLSPLWEGYKNFWPPLFPMFTPLCVNVVSPIGQSMEITRSCVICVWGHCIRRQCTCSAHCLLSLHLGGWGKLSCSPAASGNVDVNFWNFVQVSKANVLILPQTQVTFSVAAFPSLALDILVSVFCFWFDYPSATLFIYHVGKMSSHLGLSRTEGCS